MHSIVFVAALVVLQAGPALGAGTPPAAVAAPSSERAPASPAATPDKRKAKDDLVCRQQAVLGTRFPQKVCYSKAAAAEQQMIDRQLTERIQGLTPRETNQQ